MNPTTFAIIAFGSILTATLTPRSSAAEPGNRTIQEVFDEGRAAFFRDDYTTAKRLLSQVNKADPKHRPTIIMLKNISMAEREAAAKANSLEGRLRRTTLPQIELVDARVPEVVEFLQIKAAEVSRTGTKPNFLIHLNDADQKRLVTLRLSEPTVHSALAALATLAQLDVRYDDYAVTIRSRSLASDTPAPGVPAAGSAKEAATR